MSVYDNTPLFAKDEYGNEVVLDFLGYIEKRRMDTIRITLNVPKKKAIAAIEAIEDALLGADIHWDLDADWKSDEEA